MGATALLVSRFSSRSGPEKLIFRDSFKTLIGQRIYDNQKIGTVSLGQGTEIVKGLHTTEEP
jgi:hypothetical protein